MKQAEAKERILAAGMELIPVYGYNATGLDAILKKAGVPKGSFYHHFGAKEKSTGGRCARFEGMFPNNSPTA